MSFKQIKENIPMELINQKRWFLVGADKIPRIQNWNNPDNQDYFDDVKGIAGFDISGHGIATDYLVLDFDHVLDDNGHWINEEAKSVFEHIQSLTDTYIERSVSKKGFHAFYTLSNEESPITTKASSVLNFDASTNAKLEMFYKNGGRYFLLTGDIVGNCSSIFNGDSVLAFIRDKISKQNLQNKPAQLIQKSTHSQGITKFERRKAMIKVIPCAELVYADWLQMARNFRDLGFSFSDFDSWSATDSARYNKSQSCSDVWNNLPVQIDENAAEGSLCNFAKRFGFNDSISNYQRFINLFKKNQTKAFSFAINSLQSFNAIADNFVKEKIFNQDILAFVSVCKFDHSSQAQLAFNDFRNKVKSLCRNELKIKDLDSAIDDSFIPFKQIVHSNNIENLKKNETDDFNSFSSSYPHLANQSWVKNIQLPNGFHFDWINRSTKKASFEGSCVCFDSIVLISSISKDISSKIESVELQFLTNHSDSWQSISTDRYIISDKNKIVQLSNFGFPVTTKNNDDFVDYLAQLQLSNHQNIKHLNTTDKLGWSNDTKSFIFPNLSSDTVVTPSSNSIVKHLKTNGEWYEWLNIAKKIWSTRDGRFFQYPVARFILSASFATVLLKPLVCRSFSIYLWGRTRIGKSTAFKFAVSAWGDPNLMINFNGTLNGLEAELANFNDLPVFFDEYQLKNERDGLGKIVYHIGEGQGRGRANRDGAPKERKSWRTIAFMNGEVPLIEDNSTQGAHTRCLSINLSDNIVKDDLANEIHSCCADSFGHAGLKFLQHIQNADFEQLKTKLKELQDYFIKNYGNDYEVEHLRYIALITLVDSIVGKLFFKETLISKCDLDNDNEVQEIVERDAKNIADDILRLIPKKESFDEANFYCAWLRDTINQHIPYYENANALFATKESSIEKWGFVQCAVKDTYHFFTIPNALRKAASKDGINFSKLISYAVDNKLILKNKDHKDINRNTVVKKRKGLTNRYFDVDITITKEE